MTLPNSIAIDGPASSGKSTISFAVAQRLGYLFVDTGAFYRAITLLALEQKLDLTVTDTISHLARQVKLDITSELSDDGRQYTILADGRDITPDIHSPKVDGSVSPVSAIPGVRDALLDIQRMIAARGRVIMAGRDIGTVVLPDADLKIYIDAGLEKRAQRRYHQRIRNGEETDLDTIRDGLQQRDKVDSGRDVAPLLRAPDAILLDTSNLTFEETIDAVLAIIHNYQAPSNP